MEKITFTREELFKLVWSEPLSRLARKYNISDNGIRKRCKKMNIPLPRSGYWSKVRHGYKVLFLNYLASIKEKTRRFFVIAIKMVTMSKKWMRSRLKQN